METETFRQKNVYGKIGNVRLGIDQCLNQLVSGMLKHTNAEKAEQALICQ